MLEEAGVLGQPIEAPRRIVRLRRDGEETTYLVPRDGPSVVVIEITHLIPDRFAEAWNEARAKEAE